MAKKLTKKQIADRARRGWATRRKKAKQVKKLAASASVQMGSTDTPERRTFTHRLMIGGKSAADLLAGIDYTARLADLRKLNGNDAAAIGMLEQLAADGALKATSHMTTAARERFDRKVALGFMAEVNDSHPGEAMLWRVSDYVARSLVSVLTKALNGTREQSDHEMHWQAQVRHDDIVQGRQDFEKAVAAHVKR